MTNTAPTLTIVAQTSFTEQIAEKLFLTGTAVSDVELDALNGGNGDYSGATLTIQRTGTPNPDDTFTFIDTPADFVFVFGPEIYFYNGSDYVQIGTFESVGGTLTVSFSTIGAIPTTALVNALVSGIAYSLDSDNPPPITGTPAIELSVTFSDGGSESLSDSSSIGLDVFPQNDQPQHDGGSVSYYVKGDTFALTAESLGISDVDSPPEQVFFAVTAGNLTAYFLEGVQTNSFTLADVLAGKITVTPPSLSNFNIVNSGLQTGNFQGFESVSFNVKFQPLATAPELDAADDTGALGDGITAQSYGLTINGTMPGLDFGESLFLRRVLTSDGIDNDFDGEVDEEFESEVVATFQNLTGSQNYTFTLDLGAGSHELFVAPTDPGLTIRSDIIEITVAPDTLPDLAAADDTGSSNLDNITNKNTGLTFTGTAAGPGQTVELFSLVTTIPDGIDNDDDGQEDEPDEVGQQVLTLLGTTTTGPGGNWTIDLDFTAGSQTIEIVASVDGGPITPAIPLVLDQQPLPLFATVTPDGNISISFNGQAAASTTLEASDFAVVVNGATVVPASIAFTDATRTAILLTFSTAIESWQSVTLDYSTAAGTANTISDIAGNASPSSSIPVNNVSQIDTKAPTLLKAETANGVVILTFDEPVQGGEAEDFTVVINGQTFIIDSIQSGHFSNEVSTSGIDPQRVLLLFPTEALPTVVTGSVAYSSTAGTADSLTDLASLPAGLNPATSQSIDMTLNGAVEFAATALTIFTAEDSLPATANVLNAITGASAATDADIFQFHTVSSQLVSATFTDALGTSQTVPVTFTFLTGVSENLTTVNATWALVGASSTNLKYLGTGETLSVTYSITIDDRSGSTDTQQLTFTFTGQNELVNGTANDESLNGSNFADDINSLAGDDAIKGLGGNDVINTSTGDDTADGGSGNDTMLGGSGDDTLIGGSGNDNINGGTDSDALYGGSGNDVLNGSEGADDLFGGSGNDTLIGSTGFDTLKGGDGDDLYLLDVNDTVIEFAGAGTDTVRSAATTTLANNVEILQLTGSTNVNGTGNTLGNTLLGNAGNNVLNGGGGNDILNGGTGADTLTGSSGADVFEFSALFTSRALNGIDTITDFSFGAGDRIDLHLIDANALAAGDQAFTALIASGAAFTAAGQYRVTAIAGGVRLEFNTNSTSAAEMTIDVMTASNPAGVADWLVA